MPKQFLDILGTGESLLQQTFRRLSKICPNSQIFILTNDDYKEICLNQISDLKKENVLCEPARRNTAPCIAYASFKIQNENPNANIIVAPSDHLITNEEEFNRIVKECLEISAVEDCLITLGIKPSRAETGYGYIQFSEKSSSRNYCMKKVKTFIEKPNLEIAKQFIESGDFLWNSGMFIWSVDNIINSFKNLLPEMYDMFKDGEDIWGTNRESEFINNIFPACKNISIDYGIMEKSNNVFVYPSEFGWSDLGTWGSLSNHLDSDEKNNFLLSKNILTYDSKNNIIRTEDDKMCIVNGLEGYIVIETQNALLICKKDEEQKIKQFVSDIRFNLDDKFI